MRRDVSVDLDEEIKGRGDEGDHQRVAASVLTPKHERQTDRAE